MGQVLRKLSIGIQTFVPRANDAGKDADGTLGTSRDGFPRPNSPGNLHPSPGRLFQSIQRYSRMVYLREEDVYISRELLEGVCAEEFWFRFDRFPEEANIIFFFSFYLLSGTNNDDDHK